MSGFYRLDSRKSMRVYTTFWFNKQITFNASTGHTYGNYTACEITPLMYLIINPDNLEVNDDLLNKYILTHKEELNIQNSNQDTALIIACLLNKKNIVKMLIDAGCNLNLQNKYGNTALILKSYDMDPLYVENINIQNEVITTSLNISENIFKLLIDAGADVNIKNKNNITALINAASLGTINRIRMLLEAECDLNLTTEYNETALMICCKYSKSWMEKVSMLLIAGANPNIINIKGETALMIQCPHTTKNSEVAAIKKLIDVSDLYITNNKLSGFEYVCIYLDNDSIEYCFNTKSYTELILLKCIKLGKHQKYLISLLIQLYETKLGVLKTY